MSTPQALCVTGMPGCGKEEFLQIAAKAGHEVIRMGDLIRKEAARRGLPAGDDAVGGMADEERRKHGPDIWARRTLEHLREEGIVIDGLRSLNELAVFREAFEDRLRVVAVFASPETRARRIVRRGRPDDVVTKEDLRVRDEREMRWGLGNVIAMADFMIINEGSLDDFHAAASRVLHEVFG